jgi:hypothetical protein
VSEFVEECRREWQRLGVPDPIANEMAADLTADLEEAAAEGASPEDVLGNSAFDPRRFAAAWATARGVTGHPAPRRPSRWPAPWAIVVTGLFGAMIVAAGSALFVGSSSRSIAIATRRIAVAPGPIRLVAPGPGHIGGPGRFVLPFVATDIHRLAWLVLIGGVVGIIGLGLLVVLYWSPWFGPRRDRCLVGRRSATRS